MANNSGPTSAELNAAGVDKFGKPLQQPNFGFEAFHSHRMGISGVPVIGGPRSHQYTKGPLAGMNEAEAYEHDRQMYANLPDNHKQVWEDRANNKDIRSSREVPQSAAARAVAGAKAASQNLSNSGANFSAPLGGSVSGSGQGDSGGLQNGKLTLGGWQNNPQPAAATNSNPQQAPQQSPQNATQPNLPAQPTANLSYSDDDAKAAMQEADAGPAATSGGSSYGAASSAFPRGSASSLGSQNNAALDTQPPPPSPYDAPTGSTAYMPGDQGGTARAQAQNAALRNSMGTLPSINSGAGGGFMGSLSQEQQMRGMGDTSDQSRPTDVPNGAQGGVLPGAEGKPYYDAATGQVHMVHNTPTNQLADANASATGTSSPGVPASDQINQTTNPDGSQSVSISNGQGGGGFATTGGFASLSSAQQKNLTDQGFTADNRPQAKVDGQWWNGSGFQKNNPVSSTASTAPAPVNQQVAQKSLGTSGLSGASGISNTLQSQAVASLNYGGSSTRTGQGEEEEEEGTGGVTGGGAPAAKVAKS